MLMAAWAACLQTGPRVWLRWPAGSDVNKKRRRRATIRRPKTLVRKCSPARTKSPRLPPPPTDVTYPHDTSYSIVCPTCRVRMRLVRIGGRVAGRSYYRCPNAKLCDTYMGAHPDGTPTGVPGDAATRAARSQAHRALDQLPMTRHQRYIWLARTLAIPQQAAHIGMLDARQCAAVVEAVRAYLGKGYADSAVSAGTRTKHHR